MTEARFQTGPHEANARGTLTGGVVFLAAGIALVGTGADREGAVVVLTGMLLTIFGIHSYGRLGPEDVEPDPVVATRGQSMGRGAMLLMAGVAVMVGGQASPVAQALAFITMLAGGFWVWRGVRSEPSVQRERAKRRATKIEKRRRMEKSAAP